MPHRFKRKYLKETEALPMEVRRLFDHSDSLMTRWDDQIASINQTITRIGKRSDTFEDIKVINEIYPGTD